MDTAMLGMFRVLSESFQRFIISSLHEHIRVCMALVDCQVFQAGGGCRPVVLHEHTNCTV